VYVGSGYKFKLAVVEVRKNGLKKHNQCLEKVENGGTIAYNSLSMP
jgi:hypothetical protein